MQYLSQALKRSVSTLPRLDPQGKAIPTTVLITGGSTGIGFSFAKCFRKDGYNLILVSDNQNKLQKASTQLAQFGSGEIISIPADLSVCGSPQKLFDEIQSRKLSVDILVNNAGHGKNSLFLEEDIQAIESQHHLNVNTYTLLTRLFVPRMVERGYGKVLNVASVAAYMPGPYQAVYNATKSYVLSFGLALAYELKDTPITATSVCPGLTRTEFFDRAEFDSDSTLLKLPIVSMDSDVVAEQGYKALFRGDAQYITGTFNYLMAKMTNFMPGSLAAASCAAQYKALQ